jgi:uncharacterized membrane protein YraQ (UPF0718 family)
VTTVLLLAASLALLVGPICTMIGARSRSVRELIDGFSLVVIGGICLLVVMPHVVTEVGFYGVVLAVVGLVLPWVGHRFGQGRSGSLWLVGLAVSLHLLLDGAVLSIEDHSGLLPWAVVIHRLPVGFAVAVAAQGSARPVGAVWSVSLAMIAATAAGYFAGPALIEGVPHWVVGSLEALVAGGLLHVALSNHGRVDACGGHGPHSHAAHDHAGHSHAAHDHAGHSHAAHDHAAHDHAAHGATEHAEGHDGRCAKEPHSHEPLSAIDTHRWAAAGALFGILAMIGGPIVSPEAVDGNVTTFLQTLGVLLLESAPALLLGYALAGLVPFLLTASRTAALGRGSRLMQSLRGVAFGLPLPVCSCGVLPLYESLIRRGAPPVAAMAFFVATPELGLDAVLLSVPLLGTSLTVARVVAAFLVAVLVALFVGWRATVPEVTTDAHAEVSSDQPLGERVREGLRFGFVEVFDHTMPWIALGLIIAAAAEPLLSHGAIANISPALQVPLAALIGVPVYVCASGATPVAALAIHKGLSTGAAMAFLIAGPATNVTTFGVLARLHGRRMAFMFGITVTALAIVAGWTVDVLGVSAAPVLEAHPQVDSHGTWLSILAVLGLSLLVVASLVRQGPRGALQQILDPIHVH